ncbi:hypothetical protein [Limnobacter sp.]|uniref:hypothetical protein n=1 Tax=Limnobacter sp. TaxID=2003368 RepID=UPI0025C30BCE|nr:hypothetical protein [Limnobacter sp.]
MLTHIDDRLKEWSAWVWRKADRGGGYPRQSPICNFGLVSSKTFDATQLWQTSDSDMELIDRAVNSLNLDLKIIVIRYYLASGLNKSRAAESLHMARQTFVDRLSAAQMRIDEILYPVLHE